GLINFLLANRVLRELITTNQQAADNQCSGKKKLFHGVPQHDACGVIVTQSIIEYQRPGRQQKKLKSARTQVRLSGVWLQHTSRWAFETELPAQRQEGDEANN
ncbi:hypothetical protein HKB01_00290, partial [Vibrio parahaemolyticus]|nr:hypothetical protein [Vibrio parahaemolyticus]